MVTQKTRFSIRLLLALLPGFLGPGTAQVGATELLGQEIWTPAPVSSRQHALGTTADGRLLLSWVDSTRGDSRFRYAILQDERWSESHTIATESRSLAAAPLVIGHGTGLMTAAWMTHIDREKDRFAAEIRIARSTDGGRTWSQIPKPYPADARVYDAQMSLAALGVGRAALVWTDKRALESQNRYQLMAAVLDGSGQPGQEIVVDDDVCSCCSTGIATRRNDWLVAYRDHLPGEVRDIALARRAADRMTHRVVHDDHWVIGGCPSNGPAVAWSGSKAVLVWFTAADGVGRVKAAFSTDNGESFGPSIEIDANASGYVNVLQIEDGSAIVAWRGRSGALDELRTARVFAHGSLGDLATIYRGKFPKWPSRHLGLARVGHEIYVAWTDPKGPKVRLVKLPESAAERESRIARNDRTL